jgi:cbb3-type cytochrome oxidase subunit 3
MDIRFLIVLAPFLIAFFYTLFWLKKWGAFNSPNNNLPEKISLKNESIEQSYILENIFLTKN